MNDTIPGHVDQFDVSTVALQRGPEHLHHRGDSVFHGTLGLIIAF